MRREESGFPVRMQAPKPGGISEKLRMDFARGLQYLIRGCFA
jgi:hypothetical protein